MVFSKKNVVVKDFIVEVGYACCFSYFFFYTTMFSDVIPDIIIKLLFFIGCFFVFIKIFLTHTYTRSNFIALVMMTLIAICMVFNAFYLAPICYVLIGIGITDIKFDKIIKISFRLTIFWTVITVAASQIGLIENLIYTQLRFGETVIRSSFGFVYPTDFAAHVFFALILHFYLKSGRLNVKNMFCYILCAVLLLELCDARLSFGMILMIAFASIWYQRRVCRDKVSYIEKFFLIFGVPISAAITLWMTIFYNSQNPIFIMLDSILSSRLSICNGLLLEYGISLFGQQITQHGNGRTTVSVIERFGEYTFIDMSFLRIVMMYGVIFFIALLVLCVLKSRKYINSGEFLLPLIILLISVNSIVDQHFLDFSYNPFILYIFTNIVLSKVKEYNYKRLNFY